MSTQITPKIKKEITRITEFLASNFTTDKQTNLEAICLDEGIKICVDRYGKYFDGMLTYRNKKFIIHLNSDKGNTLVSARGRFTLAHELGHYFIEAHNYGLRQGKIAPHPSNIELIHTDKMEMEADYFSSCLLMPRENLRQFTAKKPFSFDIIKDLARAFNVSVTSALIRFTEVGTHGILAVFCKRDTISWYCKSDDFPKLAHRFKVGFPAPAMSVLGESFLLSDSKFTSVQQIDVDTWFLDSDNPPPWPIYEQCFFSEFFGFSVAIIWFK